MKGLNLCLNINIPGGGLVKTITIRNEVYNKLAAIKSEDESFSELFERLVDNTDSIKILKRMRGSIEFKPGEKEKLLTEIQKRRAERRI